LSFAIDVPADAPPQWLDYEVVARPQGAYADYYLPPTRCRLQILAPTASQTTPDPTFSLSPVTTPDRPQIVPPGALVTVELTVENRSERVDRFRLECTGLPADWGIQIDYPRETGSLGLVRANDSLGLNPGDRGIIRALLQSPDLPLAGSYLPSFRLASENDANLGLLGLVYLRVEPIYRLQTQLQAMQDRVRDRPAQFTLQFANLGNTSRQVSLNLQPETPPEACVYHLPSDRVTIAPQTVTPLAFTAQPQRWWTRPWLGNGKTFPFQVDFVDDDRHPIAPDTLQGQFTWLPRPWWQLLLVLLAGLGILGALAFLIWWNFLRPPTPPKVLEFTTEDSRYAEVNGEMARVRWQIEQPEQIQTLKLTGYSPEGEVLSGPLIYDFKDGRLPPALQPFCSQQKALLTCNQIRTDAFLPGKYVFELTLLPTTGAPVSLKSNLIEITAKPAPTVTSLVPKSLVYREAAIGAPTPAEAALPVADRDGIRLDWTVTMPKSLAALHLVGRDKDGKMVGNLWFEFTNPDELPEALRPFCNLGAVLTCRDFPTGLFAVGEYRFELQAIAADDPNPPTADKPTPELKPKSTEIVKIQPQIAQILSFQINGREAPAKLVLPIAPSQTLPTIQVSWQVQGGSTTRVELLPTPGSVPLAGQVNFPLSPQGSSTITLQVKSATGEAITRAVVVETYDPTRSNPPAIVPEVSPQSPPANSQTDSPPAPASPVAPTPAFPTESPASKPLGAPSPSVNDRLSPSEQPPQFNRNEQ
jgi:hypothetical protein